MGSSIHQSHFCGYLVQSPKVVLRKPDIVVGRSINPLHMVLLHFNSGYFSDLYWIGLPTSSVRLISSP